MRFDALMQRDDSADDDEMIAAFGIALDFAADGGEHSFDARSTLPVHEAEGRVFPFRRAAGEVIGDSNLFVAQDVDRKSCAGLCQIVGHVRALGHTKDDEHRIEGQRRDGIGGHTVRAGFAIGRDDADSGGEETNGIEERARFKRCEKVRHAVKFRLCCKRLARLRGGGVRFGFAAHLFEEVTNLLHCFLARMILDERTSHADGVAKEEILVECLTGSEGGN